MINYDDFAKYWGTEGGQRAADEGWGVVDPLQEIRRRLSVPDSVSDAQLEHAVRTNPGLLAPKPAGGIGEFISPLAFIAASVLGGPVGGSIAAANGSGATQSLGVDPRLTTAAALAYGAANNAPSAAPSSDGGAMDMGQGMNGMYDYQSPQNGSFWDNTYAANNTGTMTDASPAGSNGGNVYLDDYGNPMDFTPSTPAPGVGDAGAFDQFGSIATPTGGDNTIFGGTSNAPFGVSPSTWQQAKDWLKNGKSVAEIGQILGLGVAATRALGTAASTGLGVAGSNQQAGALDALSRRYESYGAPSRARYEASFAPGFTMASDPGYSDALDQTTKAFLHKASIGGNPAGSPNAWEQTLKDVNSSFAFPALQAYRGLNANAGGIAGSSATSANFAGGAVNAGRGVYDALGAGAADIFNPKKSLADLMAEFKTAGVY